MLSYYFAFCICNPSLLICYVLCAFKIIAANLKQIGNTKTNDNQQTLMHFLAMTAESHYPDVMDFADELLHVEKATRGTCSR